MTSSTVLVHARGVTSNVYPPGYLTTGVYQSVPGSIITSWGVRVTITKPNGHFTVGRSSSTVNLSGFPDDLRVEVYNFMRDNHFSCPAIDIWEYRRFKGEPRSLLVLGWTTQPGNEEGQIFPLAAAGKVAQQYFDHSPQLWGWRTQRR